MMQVVQLKTSHEGVFGTKYIDKTHTDTNSPVISKNISKGSLTDGVSGQMMIRDERFVNKTEIQCNTNTCYHNPIIYIFMISHGSAACSLESSYISSLFFDLSPY